MKKKLALLLSVLSIVMLLGACGAENPTKVDYNGMSYDALKGDIIDSVEGVSLLSKEEMENKVATMEAAKETDSLEYQAYVKWLAALEVSGNFEKVLEDSFFIEKSGKTLTTNIMLTFGERDVTFQIVYNYHNMEMTGVTIEPVYSFGEKMTKAALNTVICMSIVFVVLIFISLLISCFKIFPYLEAKKKEKAAKALEASKVPEVEQPEVAQIPQQEDDTELVAVIAAAIAAYEGTSTSDFVVRSIRRR